MDNQIIAQYLFTNKIQTTAPYTCPTCGAAITHILHYPDWTSPRAVRKPLDDLGQHLDYLLCDDCDGCHRVARLGDIILPFGWPPQCTAVDELQVITAALTAILERYGPQGTGDPAAAIVYRLLAGSSTPGAAIDAIRQLARDEAREAMMPGEPVFSFSEVGA